MTITPATTTHQAKLSHELQNILPSLTHGGGSVDSVGETVSASVGTGASVVEKVVGQTGQACVGQVAQAVVVGQACVGQA